MIVCLWTYTQTLQALEQTDSLLVSDSLILKELVVTAAAQPVQMKGDTLMYDVSSFRVPEGSPLRMLLRKLLGIEVTADGVVMAQGRPVQRILLNGKDFFADNRQLVLDNLPAEILQTVKVYRKEDEREADTGIRTGEGEQVIDVITLPDKNSGWFSELSAGGGTRYRYLGRASANRFNDKWQNMLTASWDNVPASRGLSTSYYDKLNGMLSTADTRTQNYSVMVNRMTDGLRLGGNAYYSGIRTSGGTQTEQEQLLPGDYAYTQSESGTNSTGHMAAASFSLEWSDSLTSVYLDPHIGFNRSVASAQSVSRTYDTYPPSGATGSSAEHRINDQHSGSRTETTGVAAELSGRVNRKLRRPGRNIDVSFRLGLNTSTSEAYYRSNTLYYRTGQTGNTLQYNDDPRRNYTAGMDVAYTEPLSRYWRMQLSYAVAYAYDKSEQAVYALDRMPNAGELPFGQLPPGYEKTYDELLSRKATNTYVNQNIRLLAQYERNNLQLLFGLSACPQYMATRFSRYAVARDTTRMVLDMAPEVMLMYNKDSRWNTTFSYTGRSQRPDLFSLIPITDESDPLNRYVGNPSLRPSFSHVLTANFMSFRLETQQQITLGCSASFDRNAVVQRVQYDAITGGRLTMPDNINGNRSFQVSGCYITSFKPFGPWHLEEEFEWHTARTVGLQVPSGGQVGAADAMRYTTHVQTLTERLGIEYKRGIFSFSPYGYFRFNAQHTSLQSVRIHDTWQYGYGGLLRLETDFGLAATLDVYNNCRDGFVGDDANGHEVIANAEVSYAFLKGRRASLRLQGNDLLCQVRNMSVSHSSLFRTETRYPYAVSSYVTLSFAYRLSTFGR